MCGIAGFVCNTGVNETEAVHIVTGMTRVLSHRGPDGEGIWTDEGGIVGLGHRRLAIIDLSPTGYQPMVSSNGRWVITYNGETYNFADLRAELEATGLQFRGRSDTEAIVEAVAFWGVEETARRLNGIFAFAVWDRRERSLWLVRDRFGIKPLYWMHAGGHFAFGSELKALRCYPGWTAQIDVDALGSYFQFNYVPAPHSIYQNVQKLLPGALLELKWQAQPVVSRYWDAFEVAASAVSARDEVDDVEAIDRLEAQLKSTIKAQMISDVPLGALLSGGIDSSTVVALMQAQSNRPVRTFSIGFHTKSFNEAPYAAAVAKHLGTQHEELYVDETQALAVIPHLSEWYDEPFADSSQIPTFLVSHLARQHVTVALSGDGGDELFAGYPRYRRHPCVWELCGRVPPVVRGILAAGIRSVSARYWTVLMNNLPPRFQTISGGGTMLRLGQVLTKRDPRAFHQNMVTFWETPSELVPCATPIQSAFSRTVPEALNYQEMMQLLDSSTYMIDDILVKVDRASMAVALEVRVPLLDHRVMELSWQLPHRMKLRGDVFKWVLRNVLYRYVPPALVDRPKTGFGIPLEIWMRGKLRDWCEALLDERRLRCDGILDVRRVRQLWSEHLSGIMNHSDRLWAILQFQSWQDRWMKSSSEMGRETVPAAFRPTVGATFGT